MNKNKPVDPFLAYVKSLEDGSFLGWNDDEKRGYLTALTSLKKKYQYLKMKKVITVKSPK